MRVCVCMWGSVMIVCLYLCVLEPSSHAATASMANRKPRTNPKSKAKPKGVKKKNPRVNPVKKSEKTDMQVDKALAAAFGGSVKLTGIKKKRRKAPPPPKKKK